MASVDGNTQYTWGNIKTGNPSLSSRANEHNNGDVKTKDEWIADSVEKKYSIDFKNVTPYIITPTSATSASTQAVKVLHGHHKGTGKSTGASKTGEAEDETAKQEFLKIVKPIINGTDDVDIEYVSDGNVGENKKMSLRQVLNNYDMGKDPAVKTNSKRSLFKAFVPNSGVSDFYDIDMYTTSAEIANVLTISCMMLNTAIITSATIKTKPAAEIDAINAYYKSYIKSGNDCIDFDLFRKCHDVNAPSPNKYMFADDRYHLTDRLCCLFHILHESRPALIAKFNKPLSALQTKVLKNHAEIESNNLDFITNCKNVYIYMKKKNLVKNPSSVLFLSSASSASSASATTAASTASTASTASATTNIRKKSTNAPTKLTEILIHKKYSDIPQAERHTKWKIIYKINTKYYSKYASDITTISRLLFDTFGGSYTETDILYNFFLATTYFITSARSELINQQLPSIKAYDLKKDKVYTNILEMCKKDVSIDASDHAAYASYMTTTIINNAKIYMDVFSEDHDCKIGKLSESGYLTFDSHANKAPINRKIIMSHMSDLITKFKCELQTSNDINFGNASELITLFQVSVLPINKNFIDNLVLYLNETTLSNDGLIRFIKDIDKHINSFDMGKLLRERLDKSDNPTPVIDD